jgi:hypothetical protein
LQKAKDKYEKILIRSSKSKQELLVPLIFTSEEYRNKQGVEYATQTKSTEQLENWIEEKPKGIREK